MIKEMNKYKDILTEAGNIAAREVYGRDYHFELHDIRFSIDYDDTTDGNEISLIDIDGSVGIENDNNSWKRIHITLYNIKDYAIDNVQYLKGVLFGYLQAKEELD